MLAGTVNGSSSLQFRPHHFLCTLGFEGKGYSDTFVRRYSEIADLLRNTLHGDDQIIEVTTFSDSICEPCPNRRGAHCDTPSKIQELDQSHGRILGLKAGDRITWREAKNRIRERMSIELHHAACAPCGWRSLGVCEAALRKLRETGTEAQN